jgi:murein DD-endopeptidase MepM/ murein hydrolase activator NlpD
MKQSHLTFLYMPANGDDYKTIRVPRWLVYAAVTFGVFLLGLVGFTIYGTISQITHSHELTAAERENAWLAEKLDDYAGQIESLKQQVQQNFDFQKKARLLANLDDLTEDVTEVGVGGPGLDPLGRYVPSADGLHDQLRGLHMDIGKLSRQAHLQRESFEEIIDKLAANRRLLDATPSIRPVSSGYLSSRFGRRMDPFTGRTTWHYGVDYSARLGTPIFAAADGTVSFAGKWYEFGWTVEVSHGYGFVTRYAHCSKLLVHAGQRIKRGEVIARVGSSGRSTATHLHYEVLVDGARKNPLAYVLSSREVVD